MGEVDTGKTSHFLSQQRVLKLLLIREQHYQNERDAYLRLQDRDIDNLGGFWVPRLVNHHDELLIVEMQIVTPPYVLDFASAYVDCEPDYIDDLKIMTEWEEEKREQFGDRWPTVRRLMAEFKGLGIHLADVKPGNIAFAD